jgi:CheY-like chemotaxis protein
LHTNGSETDIRDYVKKRKVSGGTRSDEGRRCRDTFASLKKTCRKLGISFWHFLMDRLGIGKKTIASLHEIITERAALATGYWEATLIVDDKMPIRHLMSLLLMDFGTIEMAETCEEALGKVNSLNPDLVILDVQMPGMNGYEVCAKIRSYDKTSSIPVLFLTANSSNEDEERGLEVGLQTLFANQFLPKYWVHGYLTY